MSSVRGEDIVSVRQSPEDRESCIQKEWRKEQEPESKIKTAGNFIRLPFQKRTARFRMTPDEREKANEKS